MSAKVENAFNQLVATPEGQAAFRNGNKLFSHVRLAQLALQKGLLTPTDLQADNKAWSVGPDGVVHYNEGMPLAAKLALGGIGVATGGALLSTLAAPGAVAAGAGTTAAAAAPAVTKAASSWLAPLIGGGLSTIGNIAGAKIAANANSDAAKIQADATAKALAAAQEEQAYKRKQYADYQSRLQPFQQGGQAAFANLSDILGRAGIPNVRN